VLGLLKHSSGYRPGPPAGEALPNGGPALALGDALGRVLAADIAAPVNVPPFDNSQMDGYAVHAEDLGRPARRTVRVAAPVPAGVQPVQLEPGTAAPIMTGAPVPDGCGAVVPIEAVHPAQFYAVADYASGRDLLVELPEAVQAGTFIRRAGSDLAAGTVALTAGTLLGPAQLGLLAACGIAAVPVRPRFTVLLLTTGDEVQEPGTMLAPGKIFDANTTLLQSALRAAGAEVRPHRLMNDNPAQLRSALADAGAGGVNLILTTGGISKGAYEVVRQALARSSVEFLSVALQPGGPQAIGTVDGTPFLGFPGNPVSALVSFELFLRPALVQLCGAPAPRTVISAILAEDVESPTGKHQVRRGVYSTGTVKLVGGPGSHLLHALAGSNALIHLPAGTGSLAAGDPVAVWLLDGPHHE
jgi:molybdopterin molybdotransferase